MKRKGGKHILHSRLPVDKLTRSAFVPLEILKPKSEQDLNVFKAVLLQDLMSKLFALDAQPYVQVRERRHTQMNAGVLRTGIMFEVSLFVGKQMMVQLPDGRTPTDDIVQVVTVGNN